MIIDNIDVLSFEVIDDAESELISIEVTDPSVPEVVGTLRIAKSRSIGFLNALQVMSREVHSVYEVNEKATTRFDNKTTGTLEFRDA